MSASIEYEDMGLDLIMNANKRAKKTQDNTLDGVHQKMRKCFQILEKEVLSNDAAARNIDLFCSYFQARFPELVHAFEKEYAGKND